MRFTTKVLPSRSGNLGVLTLNNPRPLHALSLDMVQFLQDILPNWFADDGVAAILVKSNTVDMKTKAFCAGGDVKQIYLSGTEGRKQGTKIGQGLPGLDSSEFFRQEYTVNYMLATSPKPQISIWDGIVMGGGVGLSIHGKYRVATENSLLAMPETNIGLFPDVGSMYWMPNMLPHSTAAFLALTGHRMKPEDLIYTGLATHYVPSDRLEELEQALVEASKTAASSSDICAPVLMSFHQKPLTDPRDSFFARQKEEIDRSFNGALTQQEDSSAKGMEDILRSLEDLQTDFGTNTLEMLRKMSPTSLKVTLEGLRRGAQQSSIGHDLQMEYRMSQACMRPNSDFHEGIRAALVDKDRNPKWKPSSIEDVTDTMVAKYFLPIEHEWEIPELPKTKVTSNL